jgi:nucleoid-associated protein YgaU
MMRRLFLSLMFLLFSVPAMAADVVLNPNHPQQHVVVPGDTLWDISGKFLMFPWNWPDIWYVNPQIKNPHLIYPGDVISLVYRDGHPVLELTRGPKTYKMSPEVREIVLETAIPTIPLDAIKPFLSRPRVVGEETLAGAPYIVSSTDERLISGAGDRMFARGVDEDHGKHYSVFRGGKSYQDPETAEVLGYEAIYTADAWVSTMGDPATVEIRESTREVRIGDRLLPVIDDDYEMNFIPRLPEELQQGQIISVFDGVSQVGQYQIVVINRGTREGVEVGHVLMVLAAGKTIEDTVTAEKDAFVTLPDQFAGGAMVFKTYEKVSYVIVMKASLPIHVGDKVSSRTDEYSDEINALFKGRRQ